MLCFYSECKSRVVSEDLKLMPTIPTGYTSITDLSDTAMCMATLGLLAGRA